MWIIWILLVLVVAAGGFVGAWLLRKNSPKTSTKVDDTIDNFKNKKP